MKVLIVTAMYPTPENPAFGSFIKTQVESLRQAGMEIDVLVFEGRLRKLIYPKGAVQLRRRLSDPSIDLVHAHYGLVGIVARTQWKVPLVVTYHGDDILGTVNERGRTTVASRAVVAGGKLLGRLANSVIVQSEQMAKAFSRRDVHIIPHEVDFELFHPTPKDEARRALGLDAEGQYLLFAANPATHVKRFPLARDAFDRLRQDVPELELCVVYKETQDRLALYMSACDALVFPSYQEGSPNIVKQAMACNLPMVATDVGDVRQVIDGTDGCFVCEPTVADFVANLRTILRRRTRTTGRDDIRRFDISVVCNQLIGVYEQTLQRASSDKAESRGRVRQLREGA